MLIKVDCREKEIYTHITKINDRASEAAPGSGSKQKQKSNPTFYIMDLGDGMTIQVPIPKSLGTKKSKVKNIEENVNEPDIEEDMDMDMDMGQELDPSQEQELRHIITSERLAIGDIIIANANNNNVNDNTIIMFERKTLYDLAASIKDGRYKEQSFRLSKAPIHNHNIVYIIEGDIEKYNENRGRISKTALQSAMVSLLYYKGFSVFRTMNAEETATFIYNFANKVEKETVNGTGVVGFYTSAPASATEAQTQDEYCHVASKKEKRDYITPDNIGEIMLSQIPGISPKIAMAIMKKYNHSILGFLADLNRHLDNVEENSIKMKIPVNQLKVAEISKCFKDIEVPVLQMSISDGDFINTKSQSRKIGKATINKIIDYLC